MIKELHKEQLKYKKKLSSLRSFLIDSWYTIPYYGRVNTNGDLIHPKNERMTFCSNVFGDDQSSVLCFDFVADAVLSFQEDIKLRKIQNSFKIPLEGASFKIISGYRNSFEDYCVEMNKLVSLSKENVITYHRFLEKAKEVDYRSTGLEIQISGFPEILDLMENYLDDLLVLDEILAKYGLCFRNSTKFLTYDFYSSHFKSKVRNNALFFQSEHDEFKKYLQDFFVQYCNLASQTSLKSFKSMFPEETTQSYLLKREKETGGEISSFGYSNQSLIPDYYSSLK